MDHANPTNNNKEDKSRRYDGLVLGIGKRIKNGYDRLRNGFVGRVFDFYGTADTAIFGIEGEVRPASATRRRVATSLQNKGIVSGLKMFVSAIISCPLRIFGLFYFGYALTAIAMYFVAIGLNILPMFKESISVTDKNLYVGIALAALSVPLMFSSGPFSTAVTEGRLGRLLFGDNIRLPEDYREVLGRQRNMVLPGVLALFAGLGTGYFTRYIDPALIPIVVMLIPIVALVFVLPELGAVLTVISVPVSAIFDRDGYFLPIAVLILWGTFLTKILLGKRTFRFRLIELFISVLCVMLLASGVAGAGGEGTLMQAVKYTLILSAYFPISNLMRNNGWGMRCLRGLGITFFAVAVLGVLAGLFGDFSVTWLNNNRFYGYAGAVESVIEVYSDRVLMSCMMIAAFPAVIPPKNSKKSPIRVASVVLRIALLLAVVYFSGDTAFWNAILWAFVAYMLMSSYKTATIVLLGAVPVACIAVNADSLMMYADNGFRAQVNRILTCIFSFGNGVPGFESVIRVITDNPFGVGMGTDSFCAVYGQSFDNHLHDAGNMWLEITAETGIAGFVALVTVLVMFAQVCVSSFKRIYDKQCLATIKALLAAIIGLLVYGSRTWIWRDIEAFSVFWFVVALGVAIVRNGIDETQRSRNEQGATPYKFDVTFE